MEIKSSYVKFGDLIAKNIVNKLSGTHSDFSRFESQDKPSKTIIIGTLSDKNREEFSEGTSKANRSRSSVKNNSLSVKFLVNDQIKLFQIKPSLSVYFRVYPTYEEQKKYIDENFDEIPEKVNLAYIWKRKNLNFEPLLFDNEKYVEEYLDFNQHIDSIINDPEIYSGGFEIQSSIMDDEEDYNNEILSLKRSNIYKFDWQSKIILSTEDFIQNDENLKLIDISMVNDTEGEKHYETFLFDCKIKIKLDEKNLIPFHYDYEFEDRMRDYESFFRCLNCHASYNNGEIVTQNYSIFKQEKVVPRNSINGVNLKFEDLSGDKSIEVLKDLFQEMNNFLEEKLPNITDKLVLEDFKFFEIAKDRFFEGIKTLETNENSLKAFKLLNKTFLKNSKNKYKSWRLFQLVFIVSNLPDIIYRSKEKDDICEVLHVMTGGGKSESYFGLVLFSAFWDRLSGKLFGPTAITKFPLRMLSIQQLQRIANLFIWAEEIRLEEKIEGEPFSVAYFVGYSPDFPRFTHEVIPDIKLANENEEPLPGKIIEKCPLCEEDVVLDYNQNEEYIIHKCVNCHKEFKLFYTDEETYRYLPTFIVATDDKLAGIAKNRRYKNLFGGKLDRCPKHGFISHNDKCEVNINHVCDEIPQEVNIDFKTGPVLIIQDEMHLIKEGFGTIDSHFESFIERLQEELCGHGFKNIAMTATITGAKDQIQHLYHKDIRIFPKKVSDNYDNDFFFKYDEDHEGRKTLQRRLIGLKPNLRDNQFASLLTLKYLSEFIAKVDEDKIAFSLENGFDNDVLSRIIDNYKNILTYHNKKNDVRSMNYYLEAVVNSKLEKYKIVPNVLTGDDTLEYIKDLINKINNYYNSPESDKKTLFTVFSTSIVSHGVDIDNWNIMIFQGMPRSTAEYIQALSRIGRKYHGVVFLWFYPNRSRDLSFYQNFEAYHKIIQHKVESVPIARWAKLGFQQTITSIFNASILNYFSDIEGRPIYLVSHVNEVFSSLKKRERLFDFIKKAYLLDKSKMVGVDYFADRIWCEVEDRLNYLAQYEKGKKYFPSALEENKNKYYKTQLGMRGIKDQVILKASDYDIDFLKRSMRR